MKPTFMPSTVAVMLCVAFARSCALRSPGSRALALVSRRWTTFANLPGQNLEGQILPAAYYGAGELLLITGAGDAQSAIREIMDQGEGSGFGVFDDDASIFGPDGKEPAHYYRFLQLELGCMFAPGDTPASGPTGPHIAVDFDSVNPMRPNATRDDYAGHPEIQSLLDSFTTMYGAMLATFDGAFNGGGSAAFQQATASMFALGDLAAGITRTPDPTTPGGTVGLVFAPTFADTAGT